MRQIQIELPAGDKQPRYDTVLQIRLTTNQLEEIKALAKSLNLHTSTMSRDLLMQIVRQICESENIEKGEFSLDDE